MFVLSFLYPRPKNRPFDYDYHWNVHLPLGIGLTFHVLNLQPEKIWVERIDEGNPHSIEKYAAIAHVLFATTTDRDTFATLFDQTDAARRLMADWDCYTEDPPEVRLSRWVLADDMPALISRFDKDLQGLHK